MDTPEQIPLNEAVSRDLIPCSVCGAKGADVRQVEGEKHFLCAACASRGRRWRWALLAALVAGLGVIVYLRAQPSEAAPDGAISLDDPVEREKLLTQINELMKERRFPEASSKIAGVLALFPDEPTFNLSMARCCYGSGHWGSSIGFFQVAMAREPKYTKECRASLGRALQYLGHSLKALPFLEEIAKDAPPDDRNRLLLAECYLDLERYEDAIKTLEPFPPQEEVLRHRHRAYLYMGKPEEARKVFDGIDRESAKGLKDRANLLLAMQAREEGDFAGALKILNDARANLDPKSFESIQYRRMALMVYIESGDLAKLEGEATDLSKITQRQLVGEAIFYRTIGRLLAGKRDAAVASSKQFLASVDLESGAFRLEALVMQFLAGARKEEDLLKEAAQVNRFRANDIYFYTALISNKPEQAQKALESTPGHNFPYHAIQRLLAYKIKDKK